MTEYVTQADREAAWPFADFHCLPDKQMHERWFSGYYDNLPQGGAIQAFARHRTAAEAAAWEVAGFWKERAEQLERDKAAFDAEHLPKYQAALAAEAASRQEVERLREALERLRGALAETREMLGLCEQIICDETCPTTWRTADGQPHGQMHKDICDVLARHEHHIHSARAALTGSR